MFGRSLWLGLACCVALALTWVLAAGGSAAVPGCASFPSQAAAQEYFTDAGGGPQHAVGSLDPDRDGVACEELPAPYAGYAMVGYNRRGGFLYGRVTMPPEPGGGFACLYGNRHFPEGPRRLNVYKVEPGPDRPLFNSYGIGAAAEPETGRLEWKATRKLDRAAQYYVSFEERVPLHPYGPNECPGFSSRPVLLSP